MMDLQNKNRVKNQKTIDRKLLYTNQNAKTNQKTAHIIPQDQSCTKQFQNTLMSIDDLLLQLQTRQAISEYLQGSINCTAGLKT